MLRGISILESIEDSDDKEIDAFKSISELEKICCKLDNVDFLFHDLDDSYQACQLDQLVHAAEAGNPHDAIDVVRLII